jgi:hypothetical protein
VPVVTGTALVLKTLGRVYPEGQVAQPVRRHQKPGGDAV